MGVGPVTDSGNHVSTDPRVREIPTETYVGPIFDPVIATVVTGVKLNVVTVNPDPVGTGNEGPGPLLSRQRGPGPRRGRD